MAFVPFLSCEIKSGEFSRHLTTDFFNSLGYKAAVRLAEIDFRDSLNTRHSGNDVGFLAVLV